jgi:hypothetical protein
MPMATKTMDQAKPKTAPRKPPAKRSGAKYCKITQTDGGKTSSVTMTLAEMWERIASMKAQSAKWAVGRKVTFEIVAGMSGS